MIVNTIPRIISQCMQDCDKLFRMFCLSWGLASSKRLINMCALNVILKLFEAYICNLTSNHHDTCLLDGRHIHRRMSKYHDDERLDYKYRSQIIYQYNIQGIHSSDTLWAGKPSTKAEHSEKFVAVWQTLAHYPRYRVNNHTK